MLCKPTLGSEKNIQIVAIRERYFRKAIPRHYTEEEVFSGEGVEVDVADAACGGWLDEPECKKEEPATKASKIPQTAASLFPFTKKVSYNPCFFKHLIGRKGATLEKLRRETGTNIIIPKEHSQSSEISISGPSEEAIESALTRIEVIVDSARESLAYSHFISVPLLGAGFATAHEQFQNILIERFKMNPAFIIDPRRLHVTLFMLKLLSPSDIKQAVALLKSVCTTFSEERGKGVSLALALQGLEIMNDDPSSVQILYAKLVENDGEALLQRLARRLVLAFTSAGLLSESELEKQRIRHNDGSIHIKLHATLLNTKFASNFSERSTRESFDASQLLSECSSSADLGRGNVQALHLSVLGPVAKDGYYVSEGKVSLL